jgi:hypothetical protein
MVTPKEGSGHGIDGLWVLGGVGRKRRDFLRLWVVGKKVPV